MDPNEASEGRFWSASVAATLVLGVVAVAGVAFLSWVFLEVATCGGDGGSPYAPPASPRGSFCEGAGAAMPLWAPAVVLLVGFAIAYRVHRRGALVAAIAVALVVAVAPNGIALALSEECDMPGTTGCW